MLEMVIISITISILFVEVINLAVTPSKQTQLIIGADNIIELEDTDIENNKTRSTDNQTDIQDLTLRVVTLETQVSYFNTTVSAIQAPHLFHLLNYEVSMPANSSKVVTLSDTNFDVTNATYTLMEYDGNSSSATVGNYILADRSKYQIGIKNNTLTLFNLTGSSAQLKLTGISY